MAGVMNQNFRSDTVTEFQHRPNNRLLIIQMLSIHEVGNNLSVNAVAHVELSGDIDETIHAMRNETTA